MYNFQKVSNGFGKGRQKELNLRDDVQPGLKGYTQPKIRLDQRCIIFNNCQKGLATKPI